MFTIAEFCSANMLKGTEEVYRALDADPEIDAVDYECTNNCGLCSKTFFVLIDGEIVAAKTKEDLLKKAYKRIEKNKQEMDF
jgi:uncharacterized protein YuzB (UPF0349 family)